MKTGKIKLRFLIKKLGFINILSYMYRRKRVQNFTRDAAGYYIKPNITHEETNETTPLQGNRRRYKELIKDRVAPTKANIKPTPYTEVLLNLPLHAVFIN